MELSCFFMADRHAFTMVSGDQEEMTEKLIALHEADGWHGYHGQWTDSAIPTFSGDPQKGADENKLGIIDSVAYAFEKAQGKAADQ